MSRRTLSRILVDSDRLRLYVDAEAVDECVDDALAEADIEPAELPKGFEERIRSVVREELQPNLARTTLINIHKDDDRRQWYLGVTAEDDRVSAALSPLQT